MEKLYYVLFNNHTNGLKLHKVLRSKGLTATISPTPRSLSKCCGVSLIVDEAELEEVREAIRENDIEILDIEYIKKDVNNNRDVYC
ncbi:DUF3343 domain-containing protein [Peptostreptococcus anaerobius]|uniref:DUF3343 domain-containing protein n=1 Tax=Peptostreptococcus anaerobius TaxID=1261 RepID=UPI00254A4726|nr:DUF3343 domain-containing protein [Peptostreptococcus anaerobius]MDK8277270.1 DUF3343 domain-containing protein [Peptostreptococcus anaerobius]